MRPTPFFLPVPLPHTTPSPLLLLPLLLTLTLLPTPSQAHGYLSHPPARAAGPATSLACGKPITDAIQRDNTSHIEGLPELALAADSGFDASACNLWLCRGIQFADNNNIQVWRAGQTVGVKVKITIPHDGSANVSIVDAARNEVVGDMLVFWEAGYANEREFFAGSLPVNNTEFNITLPDVGARCGRAGDCVLQWWWYGKGARQTYESCVDFVMVPAGDKAGLDTRAEGQFGWRRWVGLLPWRRTRADEERPRKAFSSRLDR
ncbi:hypothetical protein CONLIGDRAFT_193181 [Coniochaeta ligniaria NRRL 30616]|uniref:Chitin-binding type-4 domain-containing protein n=1 Tax=Coniochaeta ligniaria NRRL 30616 TaxID=1408157 RepID=A0A1J7K0X1_9PEZI|nr:hypothetical protein CONLIGDRAFT_193181 [Coniochaeta ligniaria NRRL 30616]